MGSLTGLSVRGSQQNWAFAAIPSIGTAIAIMNAEDPRS